MIPEDEFNETLLVLVQEHPVLYDPSHPECKDKSKTLRIWAVIAKQMYTSVELVRKRFVNLKDAFKRSLDKPTTGQGSKTTKPYKYAAQMQFLVRTFGRRKTLSNIVKDMLKLVRGAQKKAREARSNSEHDYSVS
uniref:MADF domain-containing protein n=1 Tax=Cacopsylla melanoneura TaxID=428564 RepID=A0A8D9FCQ3_9HEMI